MPIDPRNQMPATPEQMPLKGQRVPLSTHREVSSIPKSEPDAPIVGASAGDTWIYPSEQQFYNAMKRKGWEPKEHDMKVVVAIHNHVNDTAWEKILEWEKLHCDECAAPKLLKFMGKPKQLSPKATMRSAVGYAKPFDRHDWIVDRCGKQVRYVIDFYNGAPSGKAVSMYMDVRPALDSFEAVSDHVRMGVSDWFGACSDGRMRLSRKVWLSRLDLEANYQVLFAAEVGLWVMRCCVLAT